MRPPAMPPPATIARPSSRARVVGMVAYMYAPKPYLGQRRGLKGHEDLIDALDVCRREMPDVVGLFVGGAWGGNPAYERQVVAYGRARDARRNIFLGSRRDVAELYTRFDVAVCPSHSENVGAALESLLCGVPTIATRVGGFPDLVTDGETGWLVPPRDPAALGAAILEALRDPSRARRMARRGQQHARERFNVAATTDAVLQVYDRISPTRAAA